MEVSRGLAQKSHNLRGDYILKLAHEVKKKMLVVNFILNKSLKSLPGVQEPWKFQNQELASLISLCISVKATPSRRYEGQVYLE